MAINYSVENQQHIEIEVKGPGKVNRMLIFTGVFIFYLGSDANEVIKDTISHKFDPEFAVGKFIRAIALASPSDFQVSLNPGETSYQHPRWKISNADADWDDETGKVEFNAELEVRNSAYLRGLSYEVKVLTK